MAKASWFAKEVGMTSNEDDNLEKYILTKHYNIMVTPAESLKKKLQSDRFQNFCSRMWASELLSIFCAGPSPALVCQSLGLALIPPAFRNFGRKRPVRVRHIGYRGPQKVLPTFANFFFSSKKSDFPIFSEFAKKTGLFCLIWISKRNDINI